jgi:hypothetical protein
MFGPTPQFSHLLQGLLCSYTPVVPAWVFPDEMPMVTISALFYNVYLLHWGKTAGALVPSALLLLMQITCCVWAHVPTLRGYGSFMGYL